MRVTMNTMVQFLVSCLLALLCNTGNGKSTESSDRDELLLVFCTMHPCIGAFITPTAYTLSGVMAVNGSSANGGCPSPCVGVVSGITTCDCGTHSTIGEDAITGVLIDGVTEIGTEPVWAAPLFTVRGSTDTVTLGFRFPASVVLHEVELYLFHCPAWGIGAERIVIPQFIRVFDSIGSVGLTSDLQNCASLTRVSIPLQMAWSTVQYFIEFTNPSGDLIEWLHIAEVRFSDQPITTIVDTDPPTTREPVPQPTTMVPTTPSPTMEEQPHTTGEPNTGERSQYSNSIYHAVSYLDEILPSEANPSTTSPTSHQFTQPKEPSTEAVSTETISTPRTTQSLVSSSSSDAIIALVVTLVVLLFLLDVGGVLFLVCVLRAKASRREGREDGERIYDIIQEIGTVRNESCGYFKGGRSEVAEEIHVL